MAWPPRPLPMAAYFAPRPAHPGADWARQIPAQRERQQQEFAALGQFYDKQHADREAEENRLARARAEQQRGG